MALRTITPKHQDLQQVSIHVPFYTALVNTDANVREVIGEAVRQHWFDVDRLLVQFWESHSIRPSLESGVPVREGRDMRSCIGLLMPEVTRRGIIDLVERRAP